VRTNWIAALAAGALAVSSAQLQAQYKDPDGADVQAAARAALPHAQVLDIVGITSGIQGLLKDLNARVTDREIHIELSTDVLFDFDSYALRPEASATLGKVATVLKDYGKSPVVIDGHTDGKGSDSYNQTLSERRADAVRKWLVDPGGVEASRIATKGWGKTKPVAPNTKPNGADDPEGRQKNRRVEITVKRQS